ncbi:ATPase components of ABC transporters [alpha proteobacterium U9-1i]|nr:ATPase components of ABC transporters [alpha proteobacterium U9-1i]
MAPRSSLGPALAHANDLRLTLGGAPLFDGVEFTLHKGERACLVGANGAGKSTLMRMLAGIVEPDGGAISFATGASIALAPQDPDLEGFATLRDYVCAPSVVRVGSAHSAPAYLAEAELHAYGLDPDRSPEALSGGEARRAGLARAFAAQPDILLLDEPTNHLDIAAIEDLEERIAAFSGACLIISHDRRFLERASSASLWLRQRRMFKLNKGYASFEQWADQVETEEARNMARLETHLKAEEHWLQRGVTARRSRNEGRRRKLMAMRAERRERHSLSAAPRADIQAARGGESAKLVIEARGVSKAYGEREVISNFSLRVMRGDRIGIVGPNGAGKTTLLEILLQNREPDVGTVRHGAQLEIAYVDQARAIIDPTLTLWDALTPQGGDQVIVRGFPRHVAAYAKEFLFSSDQLRQPVGALSGGERNRLALAIALARPANLLVLDEPTNDLDMDTLDALEDMLANYDGTVLIVSHDRAFLDDVTTQVIGPLGRGRWVESPGGWEDFERAYGDVRIDKPKAAIGRSAPAAPQAPRKQTKLSFKDEHRAREIDALLPKLDAEIARIEAGLHDPEAFARDPKAFQAATARLDAARAEKERAEGEWLDIELRRETLNSSE